jgi:hypothetical protein
MKSNITTHYVLKLRYDDFLGDSSGGGGNIHNNSSNSNNRHSFLVIRPLHFKIQCLESAGSGLSAIKVNHQQLRNFSQHQFYWKICEPLCYDDLDGFIIHFHTHLIKRC